MTKFTQGHLIRKTHYQKARFIQEKRSMIQPDRPILSIMTYNNGFGLQAASWACRAAISASIANWWLLDLDALLEKLEISSSSQTRNSFVVT